MIDWLTQSAQVVAFFAKPPGTFDAEKQWLRAVGKQAEEFSRTATSTDLKGDWEGGVLSLKYEPMRVMWTWSPKVAAMGGPEFHWPTVGTPQDVQDKFSKHLAALVADSSEMKRLAYVVRLYRPVESFDLAAKQLNSVLSKAQAEADLLDFLYRTNRTTESRVVPSLLINRLVSWQMNKIAFAAEVRSSESAGVQEVKLRESVAISLGLDINTAQSRNEALPIKSIPGIYGELAEIARHFAERGDSL